jgi:hypothetical protein
MIASEPGWKPLFRVACSLIRQANTANDDWPSVEARRGYVASSIAGSYSPGEASNKMASVLD